MIHQHARAYPHKRQTYVFACIRGLFWTGNNRSCDCKHFYTLAAFSKRYRKKIRGTKSTKNVYHSKALEHIYASLDNLQFPFFLSFSFLFYHPLPPSFTLTKTFPLCFRLHSIYESIDDHTTIQ